MCPARNVYFCCMRAPKSNFFFQSVRFIQGRLSARQFLFLASVVIGLSMGLAAIVLKTFVHWVFVIATFNKGANFNYYYLFLPLLGILFTQLVVRYFFKGRLRKGVGFVHESVANKSGIIPREHMYGHIVTSSLTVGLGGSAGLEAPIALTGAAFGSNFAQRYQLSYKDRILLIACGAAAGIGAAFNAPIAGVLFAIEVLLLDISISAFIPLIISAATGALVSNIILHGDILLNFKATQDFNYSNLPFYLLLGLFTGTVAVYHSRFFTRVEHYFRDREFGILQKSVLGGSALAALIFVFPTLFGEGYESIRWLADNQAGNVIEGSILERFGRNEWVLLIFVGFVMIFKALATGITLGSGGNGGNFAPSLFVGAYAGFFLSRFFNLLDFKLPESNFTLVGMAGILSGVYHAPLTAIFLIAEITGGYNLMIPLMIVSSISYAMSRYFEPYSMDVKELAKSGKAFTGDRDQTILASMKVYTILETGLPSVRPDDSLDILIQKISEGKRNIFPVLNDYGKLEGIILLDSIRAVIFDREPNQALKVRDLMVQPPALVSSNDSLDEVMKKFDKTGAWNLPVVDQGMYRGFVSKSAIFNSYRNKLRDSSFDY